ncbi:MAG: hypothetical protein K2O04_01175 [Clostridiales bacterium]|nr:hypothetical protein [Clostridiales bacterium]
MLPFISNVFNDPSDPWYYVVGVIFLLLIFGAVALYMVWVGKKNKQNADKTDGAVEADNVDKAEVKADEQATENTDATAHLQEQDKK